MVVPPAYDVVARVGANMGAQGTEHPLQHPIHAVERAPHSTARRGVGTRYLPTYGTETLPTSNPAELSQ